MSSGSSTVETTSFLSAAGDGEDGFAWTDQVKNSRYIRGAGGRSSRGSRHGGHSRGENSDATLNSLRSQLNEQSVKIDRLEALIVDMHRLIKNDAVIAHYSASAHRGKAGVDKNA